MRFHIIASVVTAAKSLGSQECIGNGCITKDDGTALLQTKIVQSDARTGTAQARCESVMRNAPASVGSAMFSDSYNVCSQEVTLLSNADFAGSYIISSPGIYQITEDIIMGPGIPGWGMLPPVDSEQYALEKGYWLGFFAAIVVASENVFLDLNGKSISQSPEMVMRQRFFSILELGERPFKAAQGPPQFASMKDDFQVATNLVVSDGTLGLSSHTGIHGVDNNNIWIDNVHIRDFETGGIQLNGAHNVHISNTQVGPALGYSAATQGRSPSRHGTVPGQATLSQAMLLMRIASTRGALSDPAFTRLGESIDRYISRFISGEDFDDRDKVFENEHKVPIGSALYGILFHSAKIAVHDFSSCSDDDGEGDGFGPLNLTNIEISRLKLRTDEVVLTTSAAQGVNRRMVMGPAGDVFQFFRLRNTSDNNAYVGNVLSEAQMAMGRMRREEEASSGMSADDLFANFGGTNIPAEVESWSRGEISFDQMMEDIQAQFVCEKDAMGHHNKGVMGLRIEHHDHVNLQNVTTEHLENLGQQSEVVHCTNEDDASYQGNDARGITMTNVRNVCMNDVRFDYITSQHGYAYGVEERHAGVEYSSGCCQDYHVRGVSGLMGSTNRDIGSAGMLDSDSNHVYR